MSLSPVRGATAVRLDQPLPADLGSATRWSAVLRYRRWPVFSKRWLLGRLLLFGLALLGLAALTALGLLASGIGAATALLAGGWMLVGFLLMAFAGPLMAALVRYRGLPAVPERRWMVAAVLVGIALSFFIERWASGHIDALVKVVLAEGRLAHAAGMADAADIARVPWVVAVNVVAELLFYFLVGGGAALLGYRREQQQWDSARQRQHLRCVEQQQRESELRLAVLQAQVAPHFLFNTLASVRALLASDPPRAEQTLDALVDHLRATVPMPDGIETPSASTLAQQIDVARSYLEVMRLRLGDRLVHRVDADAACLAQPFPPLLLITLVENAVKHGIEPKRGPGLIVLKAVRDGSLLRVSVIDDGVGLAPGMGRGMGLANVRGQLAARFGAVARLELADREAGGFQATVVVPWSEP